ncbi:hypothetical protein Hdeb2414_s0004g00134581 [Helianthus debilis subsp. tardiflorus]
MTDSCSGPGLSLVQIRYKLVRLGFGSHGSHLIQVRSTSASVQDSVTPSRLGQTRVNSGQLSRVWAKQSKSANVRTGML